MKEILKLSFGRAKDNFDEEFEFNSETIHVRSMGVDYDFDLALALVKRYADEVDAIALSGFPLDIKIQKRHYSHRMVQEIKKVAGNVPVHDGNMIRKAIFPWALKKYMDQEKHFLAHKKVSFYTGLLQWNYLSFFEEQGCELFFADVFFSLGIPVTLRGIPALEKFMKLNAPFLTRMKLKEKVIRDFNALETKSKTMEKFFNADIFVLHESQLRFIKLNDLKGKTVIIDHLNELAEKRLFAAGAEKIVVLFPNAGLNSKIGLSVIEAMLCLGDDNVLHGDKVLDYILSADITPKSIINPLPGMARDRFAFVIHPLSKNQIAKHQLLRFLKDSPLLDVAEKITGHVPGHHYCKITGIRSEYNGKEVEGDLYLLLSTPKMLLTTPVEKVYASLVDICHKAHKGGAKIIGLGAYTKIVGDAGVTVNERSPIPLTTGNSLSAASTLWAASYGIEKMGMVNKKNNRYEGTCVVIGATGSIGKICAKVLSKQWERIVVVAPRPYKVLELVNHLKEFSPETEVLGTTNTSKYLSEADLIITSTSAQGEKVMDIEKVRPGCVICDVSRPFDLDLDDAAKRPDVLIIASGEVELPGEVKIEKTIGLHGDVVYACLAETALLAMEGLHESFSLSRELSYERIVQIDRLARKHGIRLSSIMGHTGEINENEIELCREYALKKLGTNSKQSAKSIIVEPETEEAVK